MDWPKTLTDGTDWEAVFEDSNTGLIPLVSSASTHAKLRAVTTLLVEQLFLRDGDAKYRADYLASLDRIFGSVAASDSDRPAGDVLAPVIEFMRSIKRERIARAGPPRADVELPTASDEDETTEEIFASVFCAYVRARFEVLTGGLDPALMAAGTPPFILSAVFAERFVDCLGRHFFPRLAEENKGLLIRAETQAPTARRPYIEEQMNDQKFRAAFMKSWADIWKDLTQPKTLPPRPIEKPQSPLAKLFGKGAPQKTVGREMTLEEWKAAGAAAKRAKLVWSEIVEDTGAYLAPTDDDNRLLMNMPGRTPGSFQKQIAGIAQIVVQGGRRETFEAFQNGRDIDLALLVAAYRHPASMLGGDGFVSKMLGGYPEAFRRERYPLVSRYIFGAG